MNGLFSHFSLKSSYSHLFRFGLHAKGHCAAAAGKKGKKESCVVAKE
jgi:hypothetical protein